MARTKAQIRAATTTEASTLPGNAHEHPEPAESEAAEADLGNNSDDHPEPLNTRTLLQKGDPSQATSNATPGSRTPWYIGDMAIWEDFVVYIDNPGLTPNKIKSENFDASQCKQQGDIEDNGHDMQKRLSKLRADIDFIRPNNRHVLDNSHTLKQKSTLAGDEATDRMDAMSDVLQTRIKKQPPVAIVKSEPKSTIGTISDEDGDKDAMPLCLRVDLWKGQQQDLQCEPGSEGATADHAQPENVDESKTPDETMDADSGLGHLKQVGGARSSPDGVHDLCSSAEILSLSENSADALDSICANLPCAKTLCSPGFEHIHIHGNAHEPAHTITAPRASNNVNQATFEFKKREFCPPANPAHLFNLQRKKFEHWAKLDPDCESVTVDLIRQLTNCRSVNKYNQPQCRSCIKRSLGDKCRFVGIRLVIRIQIRLCGEVNETTLYLLYPMLYSRLSKSPEIRFKTMPIYLPGRRVEPNDDTWTEFHILCQTVSTIKSLLRVELTIVRDTRMSTLRGSHNGAITFNSDADMALYGDFEEASVVDACAKTHPLYGCSLIPCILRNMPRGGHQKCEKCNAPIFSAYFACCLCMSEVCEKCFVAWDDSNVNDSYVLLASKTEAEGDQRAEKRSDLSYCKQLIQTESSGDWKRHETRHKKVQFVRISHFSQGELEMMLRKANKIVGYCDYLDKRMPSGYSTISLCSDELGLRDPDQKIDYSWIYELLDAIDKDSEVIVNLGDADYSERLQSQSANDVWQRANESPDAGTSRSCSRYLEFKWDMKIRDLRLNSRQPLKSWNLPPIYVACDGLTLREFSRAWEDNAVVVATGLLDDCDLQQWKPNTLLTTINVLSADVFEMGSKMRSSSSWPLDQFLQLFGESCAKLTARDRQKWTKCNDVLLSARRRACVKPKKEDEVERPDQAPISEGGNGPGSRQPSKGKAKAKAKAKGRSKGKPSAASGYAGSGRSAGGCLDIGETRDGDTAKGGRDRSTKRDEKRKENEMQDKVKATEFLKKKLDAVLQKVPFSEYTSKNGSLNLVNRLPEPYARPNLDPELQLTYGNSGVGSRDNLRCEVADMVNVLVYASSKADLDYSALNNIHQVKASRGRPRKINPAAAKEESSNKTRDESADDKDAVVVQWDIFPAEATEIIGEFKQNSSNTNVVYDQSAFLDDRDLQRMYREYGDEARCFRVYQRVGDAVFVPAGCAFQRVTLRNAIAVQSRFLSPEHANIAHQVSSVFSNKKYGYRRDDILPVMDILWWIWMGKPEDLGSIVAAFTTAPQQGRGVKRRESCSERSDKRSKTSAANTEPRSGRETRRNANSPSLDLI